MMQYQDDQGQNGFRLLMGQIMANQSAQSAQLASAAERLTRLEERMATLIKTSVANDAQLASLNAKMDVVIKIDERVSALEERADAEDDQTLELEKESQKNRSLVLVAIVGGVFALLTTIVNVISSFALR